MASTHFTTGTTITSEWLNDVNDAVYEGNITAEGVQYTPPFTGGVTETVEAKLAQTVSVKDFGAVGDGVTDDTAAIRSAYASIGSNGGTVIWPDGTYVTSKTIFVKSNTTTVFHGGAVIDPVALAAFEKLTLGGVDWGYAIFMNEKYDGLISDRDVNIAYYGVRIIPTNKDFVWANGTSWNGHGIDSRHVTNLRISNCYAENIADLCGCLNCYDVIVSDNKAYGISNSAYDFWEGCYNVVVKNNFAYKCNNGCNWNAVATFATGAFISSICVIDGNYFQGGYNAAIFVEPLNATSNCYMVKIVNNTIDQENNSASFCSGIVVHRSHDILIANNTIFRIAGSNVPINVSTDDTGNNSYNVSIVNNNILNCNIPSQAYIEAFGTDHFIANNTASNSTSAIGVVVDSPSSIVINNNLDGATYSIANRTSTGTPTPPALEASIDKTNGNWFFKQKVKTDGGFLDTVAFAVTATGTDLVTAYAIEKTFVYVTTVPAGTGVVLPTAAANIGRQITVFNKGANTLTIYAPVGDVVDGAASITLAANSNVQIVSLNAGFWKSI